MTDVWSNLHTVWSHFTFTVLSNLHLQYDLIYIYSTVFFIVVWFYMAVIYLYQAQTIFDIFKWPSKGLVSYPIHTLRRLPLCLCYPELAPEVPVDISLGHPLWTQCTEWDDNQLYSRSCLQQDRSWTIVILLLQIHQISIYIQYIQSK